MSASRPHRQTIEVLKTDPDLARGIPAELLARAEAACAASVLQLRSGHWPQVESNGDGAGFGLLVIEGYLARHLGPDGHASAELLGPGDLVRPWESFSDADDLELDPRWTVLSRVRLAVLGTAFANRAAPYPAVAANLVGRSLARARELAIQAMIVQQRPIELRARLEFAHLAQRWGRVRRDGVHLPLPLTHSLIAELIATRRPTVTSALRGLRRAGLVSRTDDGWLLRGALAELPTRIRLDAPAVSPVREPRKPVRPPG